MTNSKLPSPKVLLQGAVTILAMVAVAVISYLLTPGGEALYQTWHPLAIVALQALLPALLGAVAGYLKPDPLRDRGERAVRESAAQALADHDAAIRASGARRAYREDPQPELPTD